jgi:two-component system, sensor histidine kinase PdtaS
MIRADSPQKSLKRLPTSIKTFVLLGLALLPLGVVAILSSIDAADGARESRYAEANLLAEVGARHLSSAISHAELSLRSTVMTLSASSDIEGRCQETVEAAAAIETRRPSLAIFDRGGDQICATDDFSIDRADNFPTPGTGSVTLDTDREAILVLQTSPDGRLVGIAELTRGSLALLPQPTVLNRNFQIALVHGDDEFPVRPWTQAVSEDDILSAVRPIDGSEFTFTASFVRTPLTLAELFGIALPILMWAVAAFLGWIAIVQLLIRPLTQLRYAVIRHADGGTEFEIPDFPISAIEIQQLALAFENAFEKLHSHEEQLAAGLKEQTRLTREVHHRVKNNLQIIASLLNLHARAAKSDDSAAAYASIQRRVDALAIVQRNLFSELDADNGLLIRPVIAELASGLQQSAPPNVEVAITLDVDPIRVGQDIAAPAAFLITELVELAMLSGDRIEISLSVQALADQCARLSVRSEALASASERSEFPRYRRVLTGMARQLQASLDEDETGTIYAILIPIL